MARTRAADYDDKRRVILDHSAELFARHGIDRASMAAIAEACGVSKALLYHYYSSKEDLLFDIVHTHLQELEAHIADADDPELSPEDRLRALIRRTLEAYEDANARHQVQLAGVPMLPKDRANIIKDLERRIVGRYSAVLAEINPELAPGSLLAKPVTMSLLGMLNWVYMWFRPDGPITRADYADLAADLILKGVGGLKG